MATAGRLVGDGVGVGVGVGIRVWVTVIVGVGDWVGVTAWLQAAIKNEAIINRIIRPATILFWDMDMCSFFSFYGFNQVLNISSERCSTCFE
jgi:hypothetical protein